MRVAIFSDIHGNLTALRAVLSRIRAEAPDLVLCAGDLAFAGPRPAECVAAVRDICHAVVYGNTEDWTLGRQRPPDALSGRGEWTREQLSPEDLSWLGSLPFSHSVAAPGNADREAALLLVHANPREVNTQLFASPQRQRELFGEVRQDDEAAADLLAGTQAGTIAFGHQHIPSVRRVQGWQLVNVSSVHMPADGDPRAKFAVLTWEKGAWTADHRYVEWDVEPEARAYEQSGIPGGEAAARKLRETGMIPQVL